MSLLVFTEQHSPRFEYIARTLLQEQCGLQLTFTQDAREFESASSARINYSSTSFVATSVNITPIHLLFETGIHSQSVVCRHEWIHPYIFPASGGDLPFDIFAASFYLISRYEEYTAQKKDEYGRFDHRQSLAFREGLLHLPLVNLWLQELRQLLRAKFPALPLSWKPFKFIPTYDIDIAYSYLNKGFARTAGGLMKSLLSGKLAAFTERMEVLLKTRQDPYDIYEWLDAIHLKYQLRPWYFFLVARQLGKFDRNNDPSEEDMRNLIRYHAVGYHVGIHPSWQSGDEKRLLEEELDVLQDLSGKPIRDSRQHYIRIELPTTYRHLLQCGIERDFSMGYPTINGFRASIASSFYWYDLEAEQATSLLLYPFCFMDSNSHHQQKLSPQEGYQELMHYHEYCKKVDGLMVTIWHNNFFGTDALFKGWREVYEVFLEQVIYWDI